MRSWLASLMLIAALAGLPPSSPASAQGAAVSPKEQPKAPVAPDDRPYDSQLTRLAEILGSLHYLRELCGANEGQTWRDQMREIVSAEGTTALRRAKLVESFNRGYRGYARTYRSCTPPANIAIQRFMEQATAISESLLASDK